MAPFAPGIPGTRPPVQPGGLSKRPRLPTRLVASAVPTSASRTQLLPVSDALAPLLPGRGLQRGTVLLVDTGTARAGRPLGEPAGSGPGGATTLSMALIAAATAAGSWCVAVGLEDAGVVAMSELGVDLEHLAIVPRPGHNWAGVVSTALDGVDLVLLRLPFPARPAMARNLAARARERRAVLVVLAGERAWEGPDLLLRIEDAAWTGLGEGHGHLRTRRATVMAVGRRAAARPVRCRLWLPGPSGTVVPEMALDLRVPEGTVDPAVHHGAVHPSTARHPAAMAVVSAVSAGAVSAGAVSAGAVSAGAVSAGDASRR